MSIFEYKNYKHFVREKVRSMPRNGHGQYLKIAKLLGIHTTMVTHIFKGDSNLSVEQALKLADGWGLSELEMEFFISLVELERAANKRSRDYFTARISKLRQRAMSLKERLSEKKELSDEDHALFYSHWYFSGIRLLVATGVFRSPESIAEKLDLPVPVINKTIRFLLAKGLLREQNGQYLVGETRTYVGSESPWVANHHTNWRVRALDQLDHIAEDELVFTNPITVSAKDFRKIREELVRTIERFREIANPSPAEKLCFLNIDWRRL